MPKALLPVSAPVDSRPARTGRAAFRTDIQALRAVAVSLVVLNHLWPARLTGGYVGVDVFFVISGYLITSHLNKELSATGRLRLASFYARRVRRLLPAAFLVLAASSAGVMIWLPFSRWLATAQEVLASAIYGENWVLAAKSVDYSASTQSATVAQHYWSLSVEEQFYLLWPLLLLGLFLLARRWKRNREVVLGVGIGALCVVSLIVSVLMTEFAHNQAYFATPVRAWEFGAGALIAVAGRRISLGRAAANSASLTGLALILLSGVFFSEQTDFPGVAALLPVLGTALVIASGGRGPLVHDKVTALGPIQYLGNISYSVYLWHWPLIVVAPFVLDRQLSSVDKLAIIVVSAALAAVTKILVEDRGQKARILALSNRRSFLAMVAGIAVIGCIAAGQTWAWGVQSAAAEEALAAAEHSPCRGPRAMEPGAHCPSPFGPATVPVMTKANQYWNMAPECGSALTALMAGGTKTHVLCDFSSGRPHPKVVWLVGDSHAQQWQGAIFALARQRHWLVKTAMLGGCPVADVRFIGYEGKADPAEAKRCMDWSAAVSDAVAKDRPAIVFSSAFAREEKIDDGSGAPEWQQFGEGFQRTWNKWTAAGAKVYVLADPPLNAGVRAADCVSLKKSDPAQCAVPRAVAQPQDPLTMAARSARNPGVSLIDLTDHFCDRRDCYGVIGGVVVYFDTNHLNDEFSALLGPILGKSVPSTGALG